jgi:hypothetical protein
VHRQARLHCRRATWLHGFVVAYGFLIIAR